MPFWMSSMISSSFALAPEWGEKLTCASMPDSWRSIQSPADSVVSKLAGVWSLSQ